MTKINRGTNKGSGKYGGYLRNFQMLTNNGLFKADYLHGRGKLASISITRHNNRVFCFSRPPCQKSILYCKAISILVSVEFLRCNTQIFSLTGGRYNEGIRACIRNIFERNCDRIINGGFAE